MMIELRCPIELCRGSSALKSSWSFWQAKESLSEARYWWCRCDVCGRVLSEMLTLPPWEPTRPEFGTCIHPKEKKKCRRSKQDPHLGSPSSRLHQCCMSLYREKETGVFLQSGYSSAISSWGLAPVTTLSPNRAILAVACTEAGRDWKISRFLVVQMCLLWFKAKQISWIFSPRY